MQKTYFPKKFPSFRQINLGIVSLFAQIQNSVVLQSLFFKFLVSFLQQGWGMILQQVLFRAKNSCIWKEKDSASLANSAPIIKRNECQKTFGASPRSVY